MLMEWKPRVSAWLAQSKDCDVVSSASLIGRPAGEWNVYRGFLAVPLNLQRHPPHCELAVELHLTAVR